MSGVQRVLNILKTPLRSYNGLAQTYPFETGIGTTVIKTSVADLFAQKLVEGREEVDWRRHGFFVTFGLFYLGGFQYYLYNHLFVKWCAGFTAVLGHKGSAPIKTFIDQAIHHPFCYFPVFYSMKGYTEGRSPADIYAKYRAELWDNCKALWTIWVPAQLVNFAVVPRHLRIPFVAGVSFAWTVVISCMRGAMDSMQQSAPTTAQLEEAVAQVAAAALAADAAATAAVTAHADGRDPPPGGSSTPAQQPARLAPQQQVQQQAQQQAQQQVQQQSAAAAAAAGAAPPGHPAAALAPAAAAADAAGGPAQAAKAGLKALVPRPNIAAAAAAVVEAAG